MNGGIFSTLAGKARNAQRDMFPRPDVVTVYLSGKSVDLETDEATQVILGDVKRLFQSVVDFLNRQVPNPGGERQFRLIALPQHDSLSGKPVIKLSVGFLTDSEEAVERAALINKTGHAGASIRHGVSRPALNVYRLEIPVAPSMKGGLVFVGRAGTLNDNQNKALTARLGTLPTGLVLGAGWKTTSYVFPFMGVYLKFGLWDKTPFKDFSSFYTAVIKKGMKAPQPVAGLTGRSKLGGTELG